ncbi:MAG: two pore domain potassium channel family protein [bacterium]|nr:two pore domain potassium channel family protein [bacterium]
MVLFWGVIVRFARAAVAAFRDPQTRALVTGAMVVIATGTWFYSRVEGWSAVDSLYFTVMTLTTVGYGDLSPTTAATRLFTVAFVLIGIGILLGFVDVVAKNARLGSTKRKGGKEQ